MTSRLTIREIYQTAKNQYHGILEFGWLSIILISLFAVIESYLNYQTINDKTPNIIISATLAVISFLSVITLWGIYYRTKEYLHGHAIPAIKQPWIGFVKFLKGLLGFILAAICFAVASIPLVAVCFILKWVGIQFGVLPLILILCSIIAFFYVMYLYMYMTVYCYTIIFEDKNIFTCLKMAVKMLYGNWWHWVLTSVVCSIGFIILSGLLFITILTPVALIHGIAIAIDFILLAAYLPFLISIITVEYNNLKSYRNC